MSRRIASLLLGLLLVSSLAIKALGSFAAPVMPADDVTDRVANFLRSNGFEARPHDQDQDMFSIAAQSGACHVLVGVLSPQGWHREVIKKLAPQDSDVFFLYNGKVYEDQPVLLTRFDDYSTRFLRSVGSDSHQPPLLGIAQSPGCQNRPIAWIALSGEF